MSHILTATPDRFVMFPIKYKNLYDRYVQHVACFWTVNEVDLEGDMEGWTKLSEEERSFILQILGFFAASDGIVIENLMENFMNEVQIPEARAFYSFQNAIENIHSQQYSLLIEKFSPNEKKRNELYHAINRHKTTKAKGDWALSHMKRNNNIDHITDFSKRLVAFAAVEGIMFSSSFCALFWLKKKDTQCPGLAMSNELIARDEGLHRDFACDLYKEFPSLNFNVVKEIIDSAVILEKQFVDEILPENLKGMNAKMMKEYVEYVADHLVNTLGYKKKIYDTPLPEGFDFMNMISLEGKTNFFERRVAEYSKANVGEDSTFNLTSDF